MDRISVEKCPACKAQVRSSLFRRGDGLPLGKCEECGVLFLLEYPRATSEPHEGTQSFSPLDFFRHLGAVEAARLAMGAPREHLLDVGAATNDFLRLAHLFGWKDTVSVGGGPGLDQTRGNSQFAFVTAWGVIDHLADVSAFMMSAVTRLRRGGAFLCTTADADTASLYPRPEEWLGFHVSLERRSYFGAASLKAFLGRFFAHVSVWSSQTSAFNHELFAVALTESPPPHVIEGVEQFVAARSSGSSTPVQSRAWIVPEMLMGLQESAEGRARLRRNQAQLRAALRHADEPDSALLNALMDIALGDTFSARDSMRRFLHNVPGRMIPSTVVERLMGAPPASSRADRLAGVLKRGARHGRAYAEAISQTIELGVARGRYPSAAMQLRRILKEYTGTKGVVVYPPFVEYSSLRQRPHQLGRALADQGYLVFFCTRDPRRDDVSGFRKLSENFYVSSAPRGVFGIVDDPIIYLSRPRGWRETVRRLTGSEKARIFYDWIDDLGVFGDIGQQIDEHVELIGSADVVAASASLLFAEARRLRSDVLMLPNGVRIEDFEEIAAADPPQTLRAAVAEKRTVVGYYGSISSWFDFDLSQRVLELNPDKVFIVIGKIWGLDDSQTLQWRRLNEASNMVYVEHIDYTELGGYVRWWDVATIPFILNSITHATSPVKLFEYMAAGKPIVTTGMLECKKYESVLWGNTPQDFSDKLSEALTRRHDERYRETLRREALANTWADRASILDAAFQRRDILRA